MIRPLLAANNLAWADGVTITASAEDPGYPDSNLELMDGDVRWWADAAGSSTTLTLDLGSAQAVNFVGLFHHTLDSTIALTIAGNSADAWGAPALGPLSIYPGTKNSWKLFSANQTYRYWQFGLAVDGGASIVSKVAVPFVGTADVVNAAAVPIQPYLATPQRTQQTQFRNVTAETRFGVGRYYTRERERQQFQLSWQGLSPAERALFTTMSTRTLGNYRPLVLVIDPDSHDQAFYVKIPPETTWDLWGFNRVLHGGLSLVMLEEPMPLEV